MAAKNRWHRFFDWTAGNAPVALSVLGLVLYCIVRTGYASFYARFGLQPEEVGLTETRMLAQAAIALGTLILAALLVGAVLYWLGPFKSLRFVTFNVGVCLLVGMVLWFGVLSWHLGTQARAGHAVRPGIGHMAGNPLGLRAEHASITTLGAAAPAVPTAALYLGQADGTVVLYDADGRRTIRAPSSSVVVSITTGAQLNRGRLKPRQYVTDLFAPTASFVVDAAGWASDVDTEGELEFSRTMQTSPETLTLLSFAQKPADILNELRRSRLVVHRREGKGTLAGLPAATLDVDVAPSAPKRVDLLPLAGSSRNAKPSAYFFLLPGEHTQFLLIRFGDRTVVAAVEAAKADFRSFAGTSTDFLESLRLG